METGITTQTSCPTLDSRGEEMKSANQRDTCMHIPNTATLPASNQDLLNTGVHQTKNAVYSNIQWAIAHSQKEANAAICTDIHRIGESC